MSKYLEIIRIRFLMMLAYRTNYYTGIIIYTINIGAYFFLWKAIYGNQGSIQGVSVNQMTTYVAIAWMARAFYFNNLDREIAEEIVEGKVAIELIRPYNYLLTKVMQGLGEGIFRFFFFSIPGFIIVALIFRLDVSFDLTTLVLFLVASVFSFAINTQLNLLTGLMAFFLQNNMGFIQAKRVIIDLFSGLTIPITFFPLWAQGVMKYLPFQGISYIPSMIFAQGIKGDLIVKGLLFQFAWVLILCIPITFIWYKAKKHLVVQGG
ncbi:ABC-2 family transporter protein [Bacillus sp. EAC]|uniref:ABC transporter permease n=1 Tax=Bacillus sp. EAC TaxID=1978338 RepID=UPI000B4517C1|nr:ABC-2 family transporter protein [Bacillus sp. EAC]